MSTIYQPSKQLINTAETSNTDLASHIIDLWISDMLNFAPYSELAESSEQLEEIQQLINQYALKANSTIMRDTYNAVVMVLSDLITQYELEEKGSTADYYAVMRYEAYLDLK